MTDSQCLTVRGGASTFIGKRIFDACKRSRCRRRPLVVPVAAGAFGVGRTVAESIGWMRSNTDVLVDTHGIGGDPAKLQVYGYASWSPRKGVLVLRNPSGERGKIAVALQKAFELPHEAPRRYSLRSPWKADQSKAAITLQAGHPYRFDMAPFEVLVFDAMPAWKERILIQVTSSLANRN